MSNIAHVPSAFQSLPLEILQIIFTCLADLEEIDETPSWFALMSSCRVCRGVALGMRALWCAKMFLFRERKGLDLLLERASGPHQSQPGWIDFVQREPVRHQQISRAQEDTILEYSERVRLLQLGTRKIKQPTDGHEMEAQPAYRMVCAMMTGAFSNIALLHLSIRLLPNQAFNLFPNTTIEMKRLRRVYMGHFYVDFDAPNLQSLSLAASSSDEDPSRAHMDKLSPDQLSTLLRRSPNIRRLVLREYITDPSPEEDLPSFCKVELSQLVYLSIISSRQSHLWFRRLSVPRDTVIRVSERSNQTAHSLYCFQKQHAAAPHSLVYIGEERVSCSGGQSTLRLTIRHSSDERTARQKPDQFSIESDAHTLSPTPANIHYIFLSCLSSRPNALCVLNLACIGSETFRLLDWCVLGDVLPLCVALRDLFLPFGHPGKLCKAIGRSSSLGAPAPLLARLTVCGLGRRWRTGVQDVVNDWSVLSGALGDRAETVGVGELDLRLVDDLELGEGPRGLTSDPCVRQRDAALLAETQLVVRSVVDDRTTAGAV